jgi:transcriptional regulator with XRE-family HTH domain
MDIKRKIGKRIKSFREQTNITQEGLAWESGLNRTYMNHIENGRKNISIQTLEKIIKGLNTDFPEFFKDL